MSLRKKLIRLAAKKPHIRPHILPLLERHGLSRVARKQNFEDLLLDQVKYTAISMPNGAPSDKVRVTRDLKREGARFEKAARDALQDWVDKNEDYLIPGTTAQRMFLSDYGPYSIYMTVTRRDRGIWDDDWVKYFEPRTRRRALKSLEKFLDKRLARFVGDDKEGSLMKAIEEAALGSDVSDAIYEAGVEAGGIEAAGAYQDASTLSYLETGEELVVDPDKFWKQNGYMALDAAWFAALDAEGWEETDENEAAFEKGFEKGWQDYIKRTI